MEFAFLYDFDLLNDMLNTERLNGHSNDGRIGRRTSRAD